MSRTDIPLGNNTTIAVDFLTRHQSFAVNKFGENPASAGNAWEDLWSLGGTYPFPASALITKVKQSVDQSTMRGQKVRVFGLNNNFDQVTQDVTLDATNTTTAVGITPLRRISRMIVLSAIVGTQNIVATNTAGDVTYAAIIAGYNQTLMGIWTVPSGYTAYMTNFWVDVEQITTARPAAVRLWVADAGNGHAFAIKCSKFTSKEAGQVKQEYNPFFRIPEKHDIKLSASPDTNAADVHGGFDLLVIKNA